MTTATRSWTLPCSPPLVGPREQLEPFGIPVVHDLPGVGQNLRDHPIIYITWRTKPEHPLDGLAPRMQLALRWTAEGSHL